MTKILPKFSAQSAQKGFALLMAVLITSTLLLISFALSNISLKELILSSTGRESQVAFYAADTGVECALFWDTKNPSSISGDSAFDPDGNPSTISCNGNEISASSPPVPTVPYDTPTLVGGGGWANSTSTFYIDLDADGAYSGPCAIVRVGKELGEEGGPQEGQIITTILSRGYNTCDVENPRRLERALRVIY